MLPLLKGLAAGGAALLLLASCGDSIGPSTLEGRTYALASVDGAPLPVVVSERIDLLGWHDVTELVRGTLEFVSDSVVERDDSLHSVSRDTLGNVITASGTLVSEGRFTVRNGVVFVRWDSHRADTLWLRDGGIVALEHRSCRLETPCEQWTSTFLFQRR